MKNFKSLTFSLIFIITISLSSCNNIFGIEHASEQVEKTNNNGVASFVDPKTNEEVNIFVVNEENLPLANHDVLYKQGEEFQFEAFFIKDENSQLVGADFFTHNSDHIIVVQPNVMRRANPDQIEAISGYLMETGYGGDSYIETISDSEYEQYLKNKLRIYIDILGYLFGVLPNPTGELRFEDDSQDNKGQWDMYKTEFKDKLGGGGIITNEVFIQSQSPELKYVKVDFVDNNLEISMLAIDPIQYPENMSRLLSSIDQTIFLGPSLFSDITYYYRLLDSNESIITDWQSKVENAVCMEGECRETFININIPNEKFFILEVYATDEVRNTSQVMTKYFQFDNSTGGNQSKELTQNDFELSVLMNNTPTPTPTLEPTVTQTKVPTKTNTPKPAYPTLYTEKNYNCRKGPGTEYDHVADIKKGTTSRIIGVASNGWLAIEINFSHTRDTYCWIGGGQVTGDLNTVQYVKVPDPKYLPIYWTPSDKFMDTSPSRATQIGSLDCRVVANYKWTVYTANTGAGNIWMCNSSLFGYSNAFFFRDHGVNICGFNLK